MNASIETAPSAAARRWLAAMPWVFVLIWSTGFIVARYGMPHAPPMKFLAWRYGLSALAFGLWVALSRARWPQGRAQYAHLAVTGLLMHAGYLGGVWSAVKLHMGAGTIALLVGLQPVLTALWLAWAGSRSAAPADAAGAASPARQWGGLALGLLGLFLVVRHKLGAGELNGVNLGLAMFALLSITAGTLYQKAFVAPGDVRSAGLVQLSAAWLVTLPLAAFEAEAMDWGVPLAGSLAWSVGVLTLGGSSLLYLLIQRGAATQVTSLMYLVPPCTAVLAALLFHEPLSLDMVAGMLLTALGVALVVRAPGRG